MSPRVMSPLDYSYRFCFVDFIIRAKVQRITVFNVIFTLKKKEKQPLWKRLQLIGADLGSKDQEDHRGLVLH